MLLYSSPVGATAERKGVEQRLSKNAEVEQSVDSSSLSYDFYRVIRSR